MAKRAVSYPITQQIWARYRSEKQCNRRNDRTHNQPDCMFTAFCRKISAPRFQHESRIGCRRIIKLYAVLVAKRAQECFIWSRKLMKPIPRPPEFQAQTTFRSSKNPLEFQILVLHPNDQALARGCLRLAVPI